MKAKFLSLVITIAMILSVGGVSVFGRSATDPKTAVEDAKTLPNSTAPAKEKAPGTNKLKGDMLKLVADAKAGKVAPRAQHFPNTKRNNLSTGAKIGIAAAIGGLIFALIIIHQVNSD
jgi:hypothetical protein